METNFVTEMVDDIFDSEGDVEIGNLSFNRSQILRELDPIAYREAVNDYIDSMIEDLDPEDDLIEIERLENCYIWPDNWSTMVFSCHSGKIVVELSFLLMR